MNYFAHGRLFVERPYLLAGTAIPDWLNVADRRTRVREKLARAWLDNEDPKVVELAQGVVQHHRDDAWFHDSTAFSELSLGFTKWIRERLGPDDSMRPSFLGHILVEILLDASLAIREPTRLEAYYRAMSGVNAAQIADTVARMTGRPCEALAKFIGRFVEVRFLWDYLDNGKLVFRLNQVLGRLELPLLGETFYELLPEARELVAARVDELVTPPEYETTS
jgi:hypothetical protein